MVVKTSERHYADAEWKKTWRSAAVHWSESRGGWYVLGHHWMLDESGELVDLGFEEVTDCSIYDGWWDKNK